MSPFPATKRNMPSEATKLHNLWHKICRHFLMRGCLILLVNSSMLIPEYTKRLFNISALEREKVTSLKTLFFSAGSSVGFCKPSPSFTHSIKRVISFHLRVIIQAVLYAFSPNLSIKWFLSHILRGVKRFSLYESFVIFYYAKFFPHVVLWCPLLVPVSQWIQLSMVKSPRFHDEQQPPATLFFSYISTS